MIKALPATEAQTFLKSRYLHAEKMNNLENFFACAEQQDAPHCDH
jgi:hypothetical protein